MTDITHSTPRSAPASASVWVGRGLSGLVIAFLIVDGAAKLPPLQPVTDTMSALGWPTDTSVVRGLGIVLVAIAALYAWPRTSPIGAVLLTGYLGGAVATHLRIGSPLFTHVLFGVYVGILAWTGLWLRSPRLRALLLKTG